MLTIFMEEKLIKYFVKKLKSKCDSEYFMVGFRVGKTLTDFGSVSRGICDLNSKGELISIKEKQKL